MVIVQVEDTGHAHEEQRRLEQALERKDEFVATVGEEIQRPLRLLIDLTSNPDVETAEAFPRIGAQATKVAAVVDDLVVSARADTAPVSVVPGRVNAESLCREVVGGMPGAMDVSFDFSPTQMWADPALTRHIVYNLVSNALDYGGTSVVVRTRRSGPDTVIQVIDDGPEVPASESNRLFGGDLRSGQPVTRPAAVGLGLAVGRHLARQMEGDIEYRRSPDGENIFELRLPSEEFNEVPRRIPA